MRQVRYPGFEASGAGEKWGEGNVVLLTLSSTLAGVALQVCHPAEKPPGSSEEPEEKGE